MPIRSVLPRFKLSRAQLLSAIAVGVLLCSLGGLTYAQKQLSKRYPAGKKVRVELKNISGTIIVESWNRDEVKVSATMESPTANFAPRLVADGLVIDLMGDNRGRGDVGDVNFKIQVPANSSVDLETRRGDIQVTNIHGGLVRAHVSSEGDIRLTGISASQVFAQNTIGNIFFDGEFSRGGTYQFQSNKGDITLRIPPDSAFRVVAAAPSKRIELGPFWNSGFKTVGEGQRYGKFIGDVGDGRSSVIVTNFQGSITFMRRDPR